MSGECDVTPGKNWNPAGERVTMSKLNQTAQPAVRVAALSIGAREAIANELRTALNVTGKNLLCNGAFNKWPLVDEAGNAATFGPGIVGTNKHDTSLAGPARWFYPNDTNRVVSRQLFTPGQTEVPDGLVYFLRYTQSAPISGSINPAYVSQRIEDVTTLSGRKLTFTIWVRAQSNITVNLALRQFFGTGAAADVLVDGPPVALIGNVWTKLSYTFTTPSVSGKTINNAYQAGSFYPSFTEFRVVVPQGISFVIDYAHAMLVVGDLEMGWDARLPNEDYLYAARYAQVVGMMLSANLTNWVPFVNLRAPTLRLAGAVITLVPNTGTGATLGIGVFYQNVLVQTVAHSVQSQAYVMIDNELHDAV